MSAKTLRRLAAKHGWCAGNSGEEAAPPSKTVMTPNGGTKQNPVPASELDAYFRGYEEGKAARQNGIPGTANPYAIRD